MQKQMWLMVAVMMVFLAPAYGHRRAGAKATVKFVAQTPEQAWAEFAKCLPRLLDRRNSANARKNFLDLLGERVTVIMVDYNPERHSPKKPFVEIPFDYKKKDFVQAFEWKCRLSDRRYHQEASLLSLLQDGGRGLARGMFCPKPVITRLAPEKWAWESGLITVKGEKLRNQVTFVKEDNHWVIREMRIVLLWMD